jgi:hypothetical protein
MGIKNWYMQVKYVLANLVNIWYSFKIPSVASYLIHETEGVYCSVSIAGISETNLLSGGASG